MKFFIFITTLSISHFSFAVGNPCKTSCIRLLKQTSVSQQLLENPLAASWNEEILLGAPKGYAFQDQGDSLLLHVGVGHQLLPVATDDGVREVPVAPMISFSAEKADPQISELLVFQQTHQVVKLQVRALLFETILGRYDSEGKLSRCDRGLQWILDYQLGSFVSQGFRNRLTLDQGLELDAPISKCEAWLKSSTESF